MEDGKMSRSAQTEYFQPVNLTCDSIHLNISENWSKVQSIHWMLPSAELITETKDKIKIVKANGFPYWIQIDRVGDDNFGYYTCIIVYQPQGKMTSEVQVVRWGLNIDGPDFTKLRDQYADQAVVGAIAAGILLGILGLSCVIWHYRYNARKRRDGLNKGDYEPTSRVYDNSAYNDIEIVKSEKPLEQPNGSSAQDATDQKEIDVHM
ncbi:hypothetical protein LOTGIDRAFT_157354 [Lottia gigantea]|uniref:Ig-like domain-containing protein n=1 Tax=Lottia gigantea TaxID=225164 RepID=V4B439_LOTGI|nr:hypothetical protein LOTGIDRAFT_157354 [Lottia gigantea]ESP02196.1 hypothetical protein LOTGIDRAFT_157354 [Lottia gigantea]